MSFTTITTTQSGSANYLQHRQHHAHHNHKRDSEVVTRTIEFQSDNIIRREKTTTTATNALPTLTTFTRTTTSSSSSSTTYAFTASEIPNTIANAAKNSASYDPYIYRTSLPDNLVFIIIGAIIALGLLLTVTIRSVKKISAMRRAKSDSEKYEFSSNSMYLHSGLASSNSSMLDLSSERFSIHSASSYHLLSKGAAAALNSSSSESSSSSSNAGRTYRNAVNPSNSSGNTAGNLNVANNRGSMFISPALEAMNYSQNQFKLPHHHKGAFTESEIGSGFGDSDISTFTDNKLLDSFNYSDGSFYTDSPKIGEERPANNRQNSRPALTRPPSQVLDDLLDGLPDFENYELKEDV